MPFGGDDVPALFNEIKSVGVIDTELDLTGFIELLNIARKPESLANKDIMIIDKCPEIHALSYTMPTSQPSLQLALIPESPKNAVQLDLSVAIAIMLILLDFIRQVLMHNRRLNYAQHIPKVSEKTNNAEHNTTYLPPTIIFSSPYSRRPMDKTQAHPYNPGAIIVRPKPYVPRMAANI